MDKHITWINHFSDGNTLSIGNASHIFPGLELVLYCPFLDLGKDKFEVISEGGYRAEIQINCITVSSLVENLPNLAAAKCFIVGMLTSYIQSMSKQMLVEKEYIIERYPYDA